jgi:hypothetical protein
MSRRKQAATVLEGAAALAEANTYIKRLVEDAELREAVGRAIASSHKVYDRVAHAKKASKLLDDEKLQADALDAVEAIRTVTLALTGAKPKRGRKRRRGRLLLLAGAGGGVALVASEGLRSKVLDALFGAEEEFQYSPPPPPTATEEPGSPLSAV